MGNPVAVSVAAISSGVLPLSKPILKFRRPRLVKYKTGRWCIIYYAWDEDAKETKRVRFFADLANYKSLIRREERANHIMDEINRAFDEGRFKLDLPNKVSEERPFEKDTVKSAFEKVLKLKAPILRESSLSHYNNLLKIFIPWLNEKFGDNLPLKKLSTNMIIQFADYLSKDHEVAKSDRIGVAPRTRNNYINTISIIINEIHRRNKRLFKDNPSKEVQRLQAESNKHTAYSSAQMRMIKGEIERQEESQLLLFIYMIYYTLARPREIQAMRINQIDLANDSIFIPSGDAKNKRDETIDIYPPLKEIFHKLNLDQYPQDYYLFANNGGLGEKRVHEGYFRIRHRKVLKEVRLYGLSKSYDLYGYKHTGAIALFEATKDPVIVKEQCRHRSLEQTMVYLRDLNVFRSKDHFHKIKGF